MATALIKSRYAISLNIAGLMIYLTLASALWAPLGDQSLPIGAGTPIVWGLTALPVLILFLCINFVWLDLIVLRTHEERNWRHLLVWLVVMLIWFGVNRFDLAMQGTTGNASITMNSPASSSAHALNGSQPP